jgi:hypothetical protein
MNSPSSSSTQSFNPSTSEKDFLLTVLDDSIILHYNRQLFNELSVSVTVQVPSLAMESHFHWKFAQILITALVNDISFLFFYLFLSLSFIINSKRFRALTIN